MNPADRWSITALVRRISLQGNSLLRRQGGSARVPDWAAIRAVDMVLICADYPPLYDQHSGALRLLTLVEIIGRLGWPMVFASHVPMSELPGLLAQPAERTRYEARLRAAGVAHIVYGPDALDAMLAEIGGSIRHAFLSFPMVARDLIPFVRLRCHSARVYYDMVDFHAVRLIRLAALTGDDSLLADAAAIQEIEVAAARAADVTVAISEDEKAAMLRLAPDVSVEVLPNVFKATCDAALHPSGRDGLLFVGGFGHTPNGDAVHWFAREIWPLVRRQVPDCIWRIVGSSMPGDIVALGRIPGIEVLGQVADLTPLYQQARASVAPLRFGAGAKGKVGQTLAHGVPAVCTEIGAEGMGLVDGVHVLIADDPARFAEQVVRLLQDDALWTMMATNGLAHVRAAFSEDEARQRIAALFS
jgi:glycosyltransferase involved in cell wall biosynthesis